MIVFIVEEVSYHKEDRKKYPASYEERAKVDNCVTCKFRNYKDCDREPEVLRFISFLINSFMENSSKKKKSTNSSRLVIEIYIRNVIIRIEDSKDSGAKAKAFNYVKAERSESRQTLVPLNGNVLKNTEMERNDGAYENGDQVQYLNVDHLSKTKKPLGLRILVFFLTVNLGIVFPPSIVVNLYLKDTLTWSKSSMLVVGTCTIGEILRLAISVRKSGNYKSQIVSVPKIEEIASPYEVIRNSH